MKKSIGYFILLGILSLCASFFQSAYATNFDKIIVFGDSLSDNGNIYSLSSSLHKVTSYVPVIPKNPPYYLGRFTNGPIWIEYIAQVLNVPLDDYAYGGAWAESIFDSKQVIPFGIGTQVNYYLVNEVLDRSRENHLYVIWVGSNDYVQGRDDPEYAVTNTIDSIKSQVDWLVYYGAKHFLILNLPDLSAVPEVIAKGPEFAKSISDLSQLHNKKFVDMMQSFKEQYKDVSFFTVDIGDYFDHILAYPEKYHLKNIRQACYGGDFYWRNFINTREIQAAQESKIDILGNASLKAAYVTAKLAEAGEKPCDNPDEYLFWDKIHPTRIVHQMLSELTLSELQKQHNV